MVHAGSENDLPVFGSIEDIFVLAEEKIYFLLKTLTTIAFSCHFHSYEVRLPNNTPAFLFDPSMLKMYLPMHTSKASSCVNGIMYVTPRYVVPK